MAKKLNELNLFNDIRHAWETSTLNNNWFLSLLENIDWDHTFEADGEHYFLLGDFTFTTPTLDPFGEHKWRPSAFTSDGSYLAFDDSYARF